jgi:hypothetical protein
MKRFLLLLIFAASAIAPARAQTITAQQVNTQQLTLSAQNPVPPPTNVQISSSVSGSSTYYYWIVTHSGSEVSAPAGPFIAANAPATLGGIYSNSIVWTPAVSGATYDLLRTTTSATPTGSCGCAVSSGIISSSFTDGLTSTTAYTVATSSDQVSLVCSNVAGCGSSQGAPNPGFFIISPNCTGQTNCFKGVDDDATDNCGTAFTNFLSTLNGYSGPSAVLEIDGNYGYAFTSCIITLTGTKIDVKSNTDINCGSSLANCIQLGPTGLGAFSNDKYTWTGGSISGGGSLTNAGMYGEPYVSTVRIRNVFWNTFGASGSNASTCANWAIKFGSPIPQIEVSGNLVIYGGTYHCWYSNIDEYGGNNTARVSNNILTIGNTCQNFGILDGGSYSSFSNNEIYGFNEPLSVESESTSSTDQGDSIIGNSFGMGNGTGCGGNGSTYSGAAIYIGPSYSSRAVGPVSVIGNGIEIAQYTYLLAPWNSTPLQAISLIGNHADISGSLLVPNGVTCASSQSSFQYMPCTVYGNQGFESPTGATNGWSGEVYQNFVFGFPGISYTLALKGSALNGNYSWTPPNASGTICLTTTCGIASFSNATIASNISVSANTQTSLMSATVTLPSGCGSNCRALISYSVYIYGGTYGMSWLSDGTNSGGMSFCGAVNNNFSFCSGSWTTPVTYSSNPTFTLYFIDNGSSTACTASVGSSPCTAPSGLSNIPTVPSSMQISMVQSN